MADQALMQNKQKDRNLFEDSLVAMLRADINSGEILEANGKAWELLGMAPSQGCLLGDIFIRDEQRQQAVRLLREHKLIENHELELRAGDDQLRWVSLSACYYPEEEVIACVLRDITETKQTLLELQKVNFELDNFVYHASHDLRSPLRSILGLINILRVEDNEKAKQNCVDLIEGSIKRLDDLVQDLLSMSRNNRINDPYVEINFMNEINYSFANFYHVSDTKNLEITTQVVQRIPFLSDITRIRIILNNLLSNAIKYRSYDRERSFIHITVTVDETEAVFTIEDNGEGIPLAKQPDIFDMFVRASESSEGSGLGLYIVKNVMEKLKGNVEMISEENVGTTFVVRIPNNLHAEA